MASKADKLFFAVLIALLFAATPTLHAAGLVKWVDEKGVTHYGDAVPPEYANRGTTEFSKQGIIVKKTDAALTAEQRKSQEEQQARDKIEQKKATEQQRRDVAIFSTYTSEKEIDAVRDRTLQTIDAKLLVAEAQFNAALGLDDVLTKQLAPYAAKGLDGKYARIAPMALVLAYEKNETEVKNLAEIRKQYQQERQQTIARFDADKGRYNELKKSVAANNPAK
ncbi:MAG: DUF4124 domain-containing protein [Burkholderiales bacterium]